MLKSSQLNPCVLNSNQQIVSPTVTEIHSLGKAITPARAFALGVPVGSGNAILQCSSMSGKHGATFRLCCCLCISSTSALPYWYWFRLLAHELYLPNPLLSWTVPWVLWMVDLQGRLAGARNKGTIPDCTWQKSTMASVHAKTEARLKLFVGFWPMQNPADTCMPAQNTRGRPRVGARDGTRRQTSSHPGALQRMRGVGVNVETVSTSI